MIMFVRTTHYYFLRQKNSILTINVRPYIEWNSRKQKTIGTTK